MKNDSVQMYGRDGVINRLERRGGRKSRYVSILDVSRRR